MGNAGNTILFAVAAIGIAALHFFTTFILGFAVGISPSSELIVQRVVLNILIFPLQTIPDSFVLPEPIGWLPWIVLSLAWGVGIALLLRMIGRSFSS